MELRKHQKEFKETIEDIVSGKNINKIIVSATPGAGKSSIPIITSNLIKHGVIDRLSWVVPRAALQDQGERGFLDPFFRDMFTHRYNIRSSTNDKNPCRGTKGFVTTFQAISIDRAETVLREIKQHKYALILDEFHFLERDGVWHESIKDIVNNVKLLVLMTGTFERGDRTKIAFTQYKDKLPVLKNSPTTRIINYSRIDALKEKAILPIKFNFCDAKLEWRTGSGKHIKIDSFEEARTDLDAGAALFTALNSKFSEELLTKTLKHWQKHKKSNPSAKLLVVTDGIESANSINRLLKKWNFSCKIATSHESKSAQKAIKEFKGRLDILVTIAMAYIGLDVPEISHIAALTNIRSKPWIEQMIARGVRINKKAGPYESQTCFVFAPADKKFLKVAKQIEKEQLLCIRKPAPEPEKIEFFDDLEEFEGIERNASVIPLSGEISGEKDFAIGRHIEIETISEKEERLRTEISKHLAVYCKGVATKIQALNSTLKKKFGKRDELNLEDLEKLYFFIKENYSEYEYVTEPYTKNNDAWFY